MTIETSRRDLRWQIEKMARDHFTNLIIHSAEHQENFPSLVLIGRHGMLFRDLHIPPVPMRNDKTALGAHLRSLGLDYAVWRPNDLGNGIIIGALERIGSDTRTGTWNSAR
jgi:hypothetical protein